MTRGRIGRTARKSFNAERLLDTDVWPGPDMAFEDKLMLRNYAAYAARRLKLMKTKLLCCAVPGIISEEMSTHVDFSTLSDAYYVMA